MLHHVHSVDEIELATEGGEQLRGSHMNGQIARGHPSVRLEADDVRAVVGEPSEQRTGSAADFKDRAR